LKKVTRLTTVKKIKRHLYRTSSRGVMTIGALASIMSLPLVQYLHKIKYAERSIYNQNYKGSYGGEALIPILIILITVLILFERDRVKIYE